MATSRRSTDQSTEQTPATEPATEQTTSQTTEEEEAVETPTSIAQPENPNYPATVEDPVAGIERIVQPPGDGWEPAPIEPSEEAIAASERAEELAAERKERRLSQLAGGSLEDRDDLSDDQKQAAKGPGQLAGDSSSSTESAKTEDEARAEKSS